MPSVIGILTSDWHVSSKAPIARSVEPDWFTAMRRPMQELYQLQNQYKCPVICAGDYFHNWNSSAELINWTMRFAPICYAVPGQHDLPHHSYKDIKKSAYWTLVQAGHINHVDPVLYNEYSDKLTLYGFPWGFKLYQKDKKMKKRGIHLAVVHKYIWSHKAMHPGSINQFDNVREFNAWLKGFDVAVVGDNHIGFQYKSSGVNTFNCGSLMCRTIDQRDYNPRVGLLYEDGNIQDHLLDVSQDKWLERDQIKELKEKVDLSSLLKEFKQISANTINFLDVLEKTFQSKDVSKDAKECLQQILEEINE